MSQTRVEIRNAWNKENIQLYGVSLHKTYNADMIEYIEARKSKGERTGEIFKAAISYLMENEPIK